MLAKAIQEIYNHRALRRIVLFLLPYRMVINIGVHVVLFAVSLFYALMVAYGFTLDEIVLDIAAKTLLPLVLIRLILFQYHELFSGMWRYVSFEDLINIIRATVISTLLFYLLGQVWPAVEVANQVYLLDMTFCVFFTGGVRVLVRNFRERFSPAAGVGTRQRALIVGPLDRVQPLLRDLISDPASEIYPAAVVDPQKDARASVTRLCDVPVLSIERTLSKERRLNPIHSIIICWPGSHRKQVDAVVESLRGFNATFKIIPHVEDILADKVSISDVRQVEIDDLLERPPVNIDMAGIGAYLKGKSIMVTGGAGSIGSEICRQVAGFGPLRLLIVDRSENSLYDFEREIIPAHPDLPITAVISSVNDAAGMKTLMTEHQVEVVFHAAAYKHVPLMEKAPIESAYNNIVGTCNVARAAVAANVKRFVMISTDKAVNPANVMGVTKRIAEMVVQSHHRQNGTWFMTVRFGNVLGSAGSVIPIFKKQIAQGRALTVTHPDIERFFMTIPEAVQLVLQAGCMAKGGEIFVLDMGQPVKILKLAERLITLSGKRPYDDIDIVFSGLRPGEKMYEELFNLNEDLVSTPHPRIRAAQFESIDQSFMATQVEEIRAIIQRKDQAAMHRKFLELVPGYVCAVDDAGRENPVCARAAAPGRAVSTDTMSMPSAGERLTLLPAKPKS